MQIGVIGLGRMGCNISQTVRGFSSSDIPRPPARKTGDPRGESGYVHARPAGAGHLLSSALCARFRSRREHTFGAAGRRALRQREARARRAACTAGRGRHVGIRRDRRRRCGGNAETLRREGYGGRITMLSADDAMPCDRPNLSKGYLAGAASEASSLLRSTKFYQDHAIDVRLGTPVAAIDIRSGYVELAHGDRLAYGALLLATGADPVRLDVPGGDLPHVHYLRTLADSRALVSKALTVRRAVVIGASFIGLEVAASLRARSVEVQVVAPEKVSMEKILGPELGNFIRRLHESHGVTFHLDTTAVSIDERSVSLKDGARLEADLVVVGIGARPATSLAEKAGLAIDRGVTVDEYPKTSVLRSR